MVELTGKELYLIERLKQEFQALGSGAIALMRRLVTDELAKQKVEASSGRGKKSITPPLTKQNNAPPTLRALERFVGQFSSNQWTFPVLANVVLCLISFC